MLSQSKGIEMAKFQVGQSVALTEDHPALGLRAGDKGTVWALYDTEPAAYEVTFRDRGGLEFDVTLAQDELEAMIGRSPLEVPSVAQQGPI